MGMRILRQRRHDGTRDWRVRDTVDALFGEDGADPGNDDRAMRTTDVLVSQQSVTCAAQLSMELRSQMPTSRGTDTDLAYQALRDRILDGRITPGQTISPRGLVSELALGHTPIRAAIQRLVMEGMLRVEPRKGTYAVRPSPADLREIFEVRLALESTAAYLSAMKGASERLTQVVDSMKALLDADKGDVMHEQRVGWLFHQEMFAASGNARLFDTYRLFRMQTGLALKELPRKDLETVRRGTLEHLSIYEAIRAREPELVRQRMWRHVADGTQARIELISAPKQ